MYGKRNRGINSVLLTAFQALLEVLQRSSSDQNYPHGLLNKFQNFGMPKDSSG